LQILDNGGRNEKKKRNYVKLDSGRCV